MYIQHAPSEITKNQIYVRILHWPRLQIAGTGKRKRRIKLKPFFSMHVVIYTVAVAVKTTTTTTTKHANRYTGKIHDVQISIVQQRISKTKNYGGKGGGGEEEKKKEVFSW